MKPPNVVPRGELQKRLFVEALLLCGMHQTNAALAIGLPEASAQPRSSELMRDPLVQELLKQRIQQVQEKFALRAEDVLRELSALVHIDPRSYFNEFGGLKGIHELDDVAAKALASVEVLETKIDGVAVGTLKKIKFWDKNAAVEKAMKHLGMFEKDNKQAAAQVILNLNLGGENDDADA